ncbi:MAG: DUF1669 domain-containing protein [Cyanobacteria bacterium SIG32]|nr:DUF1669 domain-containing protein [Cyanobacteria bacterium SIG32]
MKSYLTSLFILIVLIVFTIFIHIQKSTNIVMGIVNPTTLQIDINANSIIDDDEIICIPDIESPSLDLQTENITLAYLADEYARNLLYLKPVKIKLNGVIRPDCREAEVFIDGEKYSDKLYNAGFASKNNIFKENKQAIHLKDAEKLNLRILNLKSFKYHKLDCEYGIQSSDYIITPQRQLPKEAQACKFCHTGKHKHSNQITEIPKIDLSNQSIKLILPDYTKQLTPSTLCTSEHCSSILQEIENAQSSIDMAVYGWSNIPELYNALEKAKNRGVKLRVVYDETSTQKYYYKDTLNLVRLADITKSDKNINSSALTDQLMHNKFIIIDKSTVITGSMNFSTTGLSGFNANDIWIINSKDIAELYTNEFEQMLSGKFHNEKQSIIQNREFQIQDSKIEVYFSPKDHNSNKIIPLINSAKNYIYIPTFLITHKKISDALIGAKQRGVDIKIIIDANSSSTRNTKHALLRANGIALKTENFAGKMHSKTMIIDDKYIISGSMNFSNSGENKNDENLIIIQNSKLATYYKEFFLYIWNKIPQIWLTQNVRPESVDSIGSCFDGIDNDFDGLIDKKDNGCN